MVVADGAACKPLPPAWNPLPIPVLPFVAAFVPFPYPSLPDSLPLQVSPAGEVTRSVRKSMPSALFGTVVSGK